MTDDIDIPAVLREAVQGVLTEHADVLGISLVGDIVLLAECHTDKGETVLRHFDTNVPSWRQLGMLTSGMHTLQTEEIIGAVFGIAEGTDPDE